MAGENSSKHKLMIIAGEESGDLLGAGLIRELKTYNPGLIIYGIGGDKMQDEGMKILYHINKMAFLGFTEIVKHIPFIKTVQNKLALVAAEEKIKTVVLIDYPGFNLRMAKKFKNKGIKIIYYISPQLWAWGSGRMKKIKQLVDKMLVVFPFEEKLYSENNVEVEFVGHPLIERINNYNFLSREELLDKLKLDNSKGILLLMPGSRKNEVRKIFPTALIAAKKLAKDYDLQIVVACSNNIEENIFSQLNDSSDYKIIKGHTYDLMKYAKFGIIKSGTSTLEAGYFELPMVIVYRTSWLTYLISKKLVRVNQIGMANILIDEKVVPELIQHDATGEKIYSAGKKILGDQEVYSAVKSKLGEVRNKLGTPGASKRAAKQVYELMNES